MLEVYALTGPASDAGRVEPANLVGGKPPPKRIVTPLNLRSNPAVGRVALFNPAHFFGFRLCL